MQFLVAKVPYTVEVREMLSTSDPDDVGHCNTKTKTIELLAGQQLESALLSLSHEVCHAWLNNFNSPRTSEQFCKVGEGLLIDFFDEFNRQGGRVALAELMGVPYDGNVDALERADWPNMPVAEKRLFIIRNTICAKLSQANFEIFMARCDAAGLDPLRGDCWPATTYDPDRKTLRVEARTTIKAIRRIGQASPNFAGVTTQEFCAKDGAWMEVWNDSDDPPHAARCGVIRRDTGEAVYFVARWDDYAQFTERADGTEMLQDHWRRRGVPMLGKCAEAGAYARALPECDGIYLAEHFDGGRPTRHARVIERRANNADTPVEWGVSAADKLSSLMASGAASTTVEENGDVRLSKRDERWIDVIRRSAPSASKGDAIGLLGTIREQSGCFEDENEEGFERSLAEEARKRFGRRR